MQVFTCPNTGKNLFKEVSDMGSDVITMPMPESFPNDNSCGSRLFAYACGLSGKERNAVASSEGNARNGSGITGLMKELEKTRLDA